MMLVQHVVEMSGGTTDRVEHETREMQGDAAERLDAWMRDLVRRRQATDQATAVGEAPHTRSRRLSRSAGAAAATGAQGPRSGISRAEAEVSPLTSHPDVIVVGSGPNGLTAAAVLATAGLSVTVLEAKPTLGGGCRTETMTRPGFLHDVCAAIHPMGVVSPILQRLPLTQHGLEWVSAPTPLAHPFDDGTAAILERDISRTAAALGEDGAAWTRAVQPFVQQQHELFAEILRPIRVPRYPWPMARFGLLALQSSDVFVERFRSAQAKALFSGCAAHSFLALSAPGSASFGLVLAIAAHAIDWPCARGGSQRIVDALAAFASARGCRFETERPVRSVADLPEVRAVLFDVTPRQLDAIAGDRFSSAYRRRLRRFRYGPGAFKVDYALAGPIPWRAAACRHAATVHVGGTHAEIARAEHAAAHGEVPDAPFVLVRSSRSSTRRALRRGSIPAGPIVMYRTEPTST